MALSLAPEDDGG